MREHNLVEASSRASPSKRSKVDRVVHRSRIRHATPGTRWIDKHAARGREVAIGHIQGELLVEIASVLAGSCRSVYRVRIVDLGPAARAESDRGPCRTVWQISGSKIYDRTATERRVTFEDVAGVDEAEGELIEVVGFHRVQPPEVSGARGAHSEGCSPAGASSARARPYSQKAVAGESPRSAFLQHLLGSEFVEMFVGVGAARIRDLFETEGQARVLPASSSSTNSTRSVKSRGGDLAARWAPATGASRPWISSWWRWMGSMPRAAWYSMAATNRPEVLDQALMRAGTLRSTGSL